MSQFSVTVVIPVWNQWEQTKLCLETLRPTLGIRDNVIVVDNGSEDFTPKGLKLFSWLTVITNETNRGFAKACNQGAAAATGDIVVFLNNDTILPGRWLQGLLAPFADDSVASTGPRSNMVSGPQLVASVGYGDESMSEYRQWVKQWSKEHQGQTTEVERLVGFCVAVRRSAFEAVGGFDEQFEVGGYEDEDLSRRLIENGGRLLICHESFVHHIGHVTFEGNNIDWVETELENRTRYKAKHNMVAPETVGSPLISACMIIKDEIDNLPRCLDSLSGVVDEVIIYDTGSTDGSIELAREAGATVIEGYWDDDFARARNEALAHCSGEWVLHIDADEEFVSKAGPFREYLNLVEITALQLDVLNVTEGNKNNLTHRPCRVFKREVWHWVGRLHEQVTPRDTVAKRPDVGIATYGALKHYGYMAAAMEAKGKIDRNIRIAQIDAEAANGRDTVDKLTNLGRSLALGGRHDEALALYRQARDMETDSPVIRRTLLRSASQACIDLNIWEEALGWIQDLEDASTSPHTAWYFRGLTFASLENWEETINWLERLPEVMEGDDGVVFPRWIADVKRAVAYASLQQWDKAAEAITPAAREEANDEAIWALVAESYWRSGRSLDQLVATIPTKQLNNAFAQLATAPAEAADLALEALWQFEDRRSSVLALAIRTSPHLTVDRALEWSVRLNAVSLGEHCPLIAIAWDTNRDAAERITAAAIAEAVNKDERAARAVKFAASTLPKAAFKETIYQVHELAPQLLEAVITGASNQPNRSLALGQALYELGADTEGVAVLMDGLSKGADALIVEESAKWLETVGFSEQASEVRQIVR